MKSALKVRPYADQPKDETPFVSARQWLNQMCTCGLKRQQHGESDGCGEFQPAAVRQPIQMVPSSK